MAAGELRLTTDVADAPLLLASLLGEGLDVEPMVLGLVLDRLGSMNESSGGLPKIERLREAASMMIDLVSENERDELTVVPFSTSAQVTVPLTLLDVQSVAAVQGVVGGLTASGSTSIGGGMSLALGQLNGSALARRNIIVVSDGKENAPPMIADVPLPQGVRIFTVGVGLAAFLDAAKLETLATENGGYFQLTDGNDEQVAKFFTQIASDIFGQQTAIDPVLSTRSGQTRDVPIYLCADDMAATLVLTWEDPGAAYGVGLVSPSGIEVGASAFSWIKMAPRHVTGRVQLRGTCGSCLNV